MNLLLVEWEESIPGVNERDALLLRRTDGFGNVFGVCGIIVEIRDIGCVLNAECSSSGNEDRRGRSDDRLLSLVDRKVSAEVLKKKKTYELPRGRRLQSS